MRYYEIERQTSYPDVPGVHVIAEVIGFNDRFGAAWPGGCSNGERPKDFIGRDELVAIPGGAEALRRWNTGEDESYQSLQDLEEVRYAEEEAEEEARFAAWAAMTPSAAWDSKRARWGRTVEETTQLLGPRPADHLATV